MSKFKSCEEFRIALLNKIEDRMTARYSDTTDPFWVSESLMGGYYNASKVAVDGYDEACNLIEKTGPLSTETVEEYARRVELSLQKLKKKFSDDLDDEDGFAAGAVGTAICMIHELAQLVPEN